MIDIHSHIIFGVDDGAKNENDTKDLLEESYRQGVRKIIAPLIEDKECLKLI